MSCFIRTTQGSSVWVTREDTRHWLREAVVVALEETAWSSVDVDAILDVDEELYDDGAVRPKD